MSLEEYGATQDEASLANVKASSWQDIRNSATFQQLLDLCVGHMQLLHAVDCFPNGGLCQGPQLKEAMRRYEQVWLPLFGREANEAARAALVPPLDVAFVWHLHRLCGRAYEADARLVLGAAAQDVHVEGPQAFRFSDGSDPAGQATAEAWATAAPAEPFWPPRAGPATEAFSSRLTCDLATMGVRQPIFLHQLLRPEYSSRPFMLRALDRYAQFLLMRRRRQVTLPSPVPPLDIDLLLRTHASCSAAWVRDWTSLLGGAPPPNGACVSGVAVGEDTGSLDRSQAGAWRYGFGEARRAWGEDVGAPWLVPGSGFVSMDVRLPAEAALRQYLGAYEAADAAGGAWRAGAHALYLAWLRQRCLAAATAAAAAVAAPRKPSPAPPSGGGGGGGGLFSCCFGGGGGIGGVDAGAVPSPTQQQQPPPPRGRAAATAAEAAGSGESGFRARLSGFPELQHLPLCSGHPYWGTLALQGADAPAPQPEQEAPEEERYA